MLLAVALCYLLGSVTSEPTVATPTKSSLALLSKVRPLPCHSVTMIKDVRPTEFLFIAPGNSGDCSFIFEGLEGGRLDLKVRNLKSNLPRGNGDACEDGQVRLYNYKGSGEVNLAQRLCDNEKEVSVLTDTNMAIVASSLIDGSFSVVARSIMERDLLAETDVNQFLTPPETTTHDWNTPGEGEEETEDEEDSQTSEGNDEQEDPDDAIIIDSEPSAFDNSDGSLDAQKEPSLDETPPDPNSINSFEPNYLLDADANNTDTNSTNNCSYNPYGYYICDNSTDNSNRTEYLQPYEPKPVYHVPYPPQPIYRPPYEPKPIYAPPYEHDHTPIYKPPPVYTAPKPIYTAPKPVYSTPRPVYSPPKPIYHAPQPVYTAPKPIYAPPKPVYSAPDHVYSAPPSTYYKPSYEEYSSTYDEPFRPSQPIPNDYSYGYKSHHSSYHHGPVWYKESRDHGPYPGKPTAHVSLTHDTYPMYPSYFNPGGYYENSNTSSTTPPSLTTTEAPATKTTPNKPTTKLTTKKEPTRRTVKTTPKPKTTTKKATTHKNHEILGIPIPWTANITITSGDNLENSIEEDDIKKRKTSTESTKVATTPKKKINRIINN